MAKRGARSATGRVELSCTRTEGDALWLALDAYWKQLEGEAPSVERGVLKRAVARCIDQLDTARRVAAGLEGKQ